MKYYQDLFYFSTALDKLNVSPDAVSFVISTHGHSDHIGNNNLFLNAIHIVGHSILQQDKYTIHDFHLKPYKISENIEVRATPGHTNECVSVILTHTELGTVAITGDLFEKYEDIEDSNLWKDAGSQNIELQKENRSKIANLADVIIPGHGPQFTCTNEIREKLHQDIIDTK